jgi:peptide/nickel transport system permease protein
MFLLLALLAGLITPFTPRETDMNAVLAPPSRDHLMGTDYVGMDIFSRIIYATRVDLSIAFLAVFMSIVIGVPFGAIVGYTGGLADEVAMRMMDGLNAFPQFILCMAMVAALGQQDWVLVVTIGVVGVPVYVRLMRAETLSTKGRTFVEAARCVGNPTWRVVFRHILPNSLGPILVQLTISMSWAILNLAGLSFVGLGVRIPTPEWGLMINIGAEMVMTGQWWVSLFPGLAIILAVLGFNLMGDGLRDVLLSRR